MGIEELFSYEHIGPRPGLDLVGWLYEGREAEIRSVCHSYFKKGYQSIPLSFAYRKAGMKQTRLDVYRLACGLEFLLPTDRNTEEPCFAPWAEPQGYKAFAQRRVMKRGRIKSETVPTALIKLKKASFYAPNPQAPELFSDDWQPIKPATTHQDLKRILLPKGFAADRFSHRIEGQDEKTYIAETWLDCDFMLTDKVGIMLECQIIFHNTGLHKVELACIKKEVDKELYQWMEVTFPGAICTANIAYCELKAGFEVSFNKDGDLCDFSNSGMNPDYALAGVNPELPINYKHSFLTALSQAEQGDSASFWKNNLLLQDKPEEKRLSE